MADTARLTTALSDRYTIERELGAGGMAVVYLARDQKLDREVALKVLRPELAAVLGADRFLNEIKISARLDHPHILTLIDSGAAGGFLYYVLPYVRGESLRQRLTREKQLGIPEALAITRQIASALDYAHRQGVVHRDIKPENILIQEGEAILTDFGIALAVKEAGGNRLTESGLSLGTPQYMSPEQATGDRQLDARSDIYSLGAVLYEMLTGEPPVTGPTVQAVIAKLLTERPTRVRVVRDTVPEGIDNAIAKALAKTPADRFSGAADFAHALEEGAPQMTSRRVSRPLAYALGIAGLVAIGGLGLWIGTSRSSGDHTAAVALRDRTQLTFTGRVRLPAISRDGKQLAYVRQDCGGPSCTYAIDIQDVGGTATRSVLDDATAAYGLEWSPDRRNLLFLGSIQHRYGIYLVPTLGGAPRYLAPSSVEFWAGGDSLIVAPPFHQDSVYWLRFEGLDGSVRDSIRIDQPGLGVVVARVPDSPWLIAIVSGASAQVCLVIDRQGHVRDRVIQPFGKTVAARDALWVLVNAQYGQPAAILRRSLDAKDGRISNWVDTVYVGTPTAFDVTADGGTLVLDEGTFEFDVWTMGLEDALRGAFTPAHRTVNTSSYTLGAPSPDGSRLLLWRQLSSAAGAEVRLSVMPFSGGPETPLPSLGNVEDVSWVDSVTIAVVDQVNRRVTLSLLDVRAGIRRATLTTADSALNGGIGQFAALPSGGWAWIPTDGLGIRVQRAGEAAPRLLSIPPWYKDIFYIVPTRDGSGLAYVGWNAATYDTARASVVSLADGSTTAWAQAFAEYAWLEPLADGSMLFCVKETEEGVALYRVRAPGKMERLGAVSKQVVVLHVSADLRRVAVSTWQYHGDAFMRRVVR